MGGSRYKRSHTRRNASSRSKKKNAARKKTKYFKPNPKKDVKSHHNLTKKNKAVDLSLKNESKFLSYIEIQVYLNNLVETYSSNLQLQVVGESKEHRPIYLSIISQNDSDFPKDAIFIEAGSNGEDFMAVASALHMIKYLSKRCTCNQHAGNMDYFIIPCSNPDAYEMCRSGKHPYLDLSCNFPLRLGISNIDNIKLEKFLEAAKIWKNNFDFQCSETLAVIKAVTTYQFAIKLFVSLQEEGYKIVYPYGATEDPVSDIKDIREVALAGRYGNFMCSPVGSIYQLCGLKFGTIIDFLKMFQSSIKFPYIIHINNRKCKYELKDIPARAEEIFCCIKLMSEKIAEFYKKENVKTDDSNVTVTIKKE